MKTIRYRTRIICRPVGMFIVLLAAACSGSSNDASTASTTPPTSDQSVQVRNLEVETFTLPSQAQATATPGSPGVTVTNDKLLTQYGQNADLNRVRYTRYAGIDRTDTQPDAILVAVPGTLGGAHDYLIMAENLVARARDRGLVVELWAVDRRSTLLEDTEGLQIAEQNRDADIALNFLYGDELGLPLSPELDRRAVFYDSSDVPFMANWTPQVHSMDIDAVVEKARATARDGNVFLGGHSAGTGFVARYAATDFNFSGSGDPQPGYAKLRGLVLLEGSGGSVRSDTPTAEELDAVEDAADGGLYAAVLSGAVPAFIQAPSLTPRVTASTEVSGMQMAFENTINGTQSLLQADQGGVAGNNVYNRFPAFTDRPVPVTAGATVGLFQDDDNNTAPAFYNISMGFVGTQNADGNTTWLDVDQTLPAEAFTDNGPAPTSVTDTPLYWGKEAEASSLARLVPAYYAGGTNFTDWYYPSTGLLIGNNNSVGGADLGLDTSALSLPVSEGGRGRSDIVNQTQARNIDIPVIAFGGSNGLAPVPAAYRGFASSIAPCDAPTCDGTTPRIPSGQTPTAAFPDFGGVDGGFEVYISEGYSHLDVLTANDDQTNNVIGPLTDFVERNVQ